MELFRRINEWEGIMVGEGGMVFRNNYEGHMDKKKRLNEASH